MLAHSIKNSLNNLRRERVLSEIGAKTTFQPIPHVATFCVFLVRKWFQLWAFPLGTEGASGSSDGPNCLFIFRILRPFKFIQTQWDIWNEFVNLLAIQLDGNLWGWPRQHSSSPTKMCCLSKLIHGRHKVFQANTLPDVTGANFSILLFLETQFVLKTSRGSLSSPSWEQEGKLDNK